MNDQEELRVEFTEEELRRIKQVAKLRGLDVEEWARDLLLKLLREKEGRS